MGKEFRIKRGDTLPQMRCTVSTQDGVMDLAGVASVKIFFKRASTVYERVGTVEAPTTDGIISYDFVAGDWAVDELSTGNYSVEFQLTYGAGGVLTAPTTGYASVIVVGDLDD